MAKQIQHCFRDQHDEVQNTWLCYNQIQTSLNFDRKFSGQEKQSRFPISFQSPQTYWKHSLLRTDPIRSDMVQDRFDSLFRRIDTVLKRVACLPMDLFPFWALQPDNGMFIQHIVYLLLKKMQHVAPECWMWSDFYSIVCFVSSHLSALVTVCNHLRQ